MSELLKIYYYEKMIQIIDESKIILALEKGERFPRNYWPYIFDLPNAEKILLKYVKKCVKKDWLIPDEVLLRIFKLSNADEIMLQYAQSSNVLSDEILLKVILDLQNAVKIMLQYDAKRDNLLPSESEITCLYLEMYEYNFEDLLKIRKTFAKFADSKNRVKKIM